METRRCGRCADVKPVDQFAWRRIERAQRDNYCRPCRAAYHREHYQKNRQRYIDQAVARNRKVRIERMVWLVAYLREHPCSDCGEADPQVLEFDHLRDKEFSIGTMLSYRKFEDVLKEIEKCEVVCCNCHRRRTAKRANHLRAGVAQW